MQTPIRRRLIFVLNTVLIAMLYSLPIAAQTGPRLSPTAESSGNEAPTITTETEWQNAVSRILQRYGGILSLELRPLELDGVFKPKISFYLAPDGTVSDIELVESSGNDLVDTAALKIPDVGAVFPPFTSDMASDKPKKLIAPFELRLQKPAPVTSGSEEKP